MSTLDEADRREYYRIDDRIALEITPLTDTATANSPLYNLLSELHLSEFESQHLLRQLSDRDRTLAAFLRAQNKRLDLISQLLAHSLIGKIGEPQPVVLSEGGIEFDHPEPLNPGSRIHLKMAFMPQASGMMLQAKVTHCEPKADAYEIGAEFDDLTDAQRQLLARYILQKQAQERRQAREQNESGS